MEIGKEVPVSGENLRRLDNLELSGEVLAKVASGDLRDLDGHEEAAIAFVCAARELIRARARLAGLRKMIPYLAQKRASAAFLGADGEEDNRLLREMLALLCAPTGDSAAGVALAEVDDV